MVLEFFNFIFFTDLIFYLSFAYGYNFFRCILLVLSKNFCVCIGEKNEFCKDNIEDAQKSYRLSSLLDGSCFFLSLS